MKLIIGANGRVGRLVVQELLAAGEVPRLFVRNEDKARTNFGNDIEIAAGDLNDPASIAAAMRDITSLFLCSPVHPRQVHQHNSVIDAAIDADSPYVVKLSGLATFPDSFVDSGRWHAETEQYLAASGLDYTCLHPYFFMQNLAFQLERIRNTGVLQSGVPDAPVAMVDVRDIAAVVARLLINPDLAPNETLPLTSSDALTYPQIAQAMTDAWDREVIYKAQSLDEIKENLQRSDQPDWHIQILLQFNEAFNKGLGSRPHPTVADILKRPPLSLSNYLSEAEAPDADTDPFPS